MFQYIEDTLSFIYRLHTAKIIPGNILISQFANVDFDCDFGSAVGGGCGGGVGESIGSKREQ